MKIHDVVRKDVAEQGITEEEALEKSMAKKSQEFVVKSAEIYPEMEFGA